MKDQDKIKESNSELESITNKLAEQINNDPNKESIKEYLSYFNVTFGVVKETAETETSIQIIKYPTIDVYVNKAAAYEINSNGIKRKDGNYLFSDTIKINASDGKEAKMSGKVGEVIDFFERVYVALMIIFKPEVIKKKRGILENDSAYEKALSVLNDYNTILGKIEEMIEKNPSKEQKVQYYQVKGTDLLEKIENYKQ